MTSDRRQQGVRDTRRRRCAGGDAASLRVLDALDLPIEWDHVPVGDELAALTPEEREALVGEHIDVADTVLFGSSNGTTPGAGFMRWGKRTYANVRPVAGGPATASPLARPEGIDYVIVRENLEDMYVGVMGPAKLLLDAGLAEGRSRVPPDAANGRFAAKIITRPGTEQVTRFACELALQRGGKLTVSAKTNMLPATDRWFCDIAREVASEYPGLVYEQFNHRRHGTPARVAPPRPRRAAAPQPLRRHPVRRGRRHDRRHGPGTVRLLRRRLGVLRIGHGTAPDIAGLGIINPTATLESAEMMLRHLGLDAPADRLDRALEDVYEEGEHVTPDQGGTAGTEEFATAVIDVL